MTETQITQICDYMNESQFTNNTNETNQLYELEDKYTVYQAIETFCSELPIQISKIKLEEQRYTFIKYTYPIILVFGIIGNFFSFLVMTRIFKRSKKFHKYESEIRLNTPLRIAENKNQAGIIGAALAAMK